MNFLETFNTTWDRFLSRPCVKFAEETSSYPDSSKRLWCSSEFLKDADDAIACLAILPLVCPSTRNYYFINDLREHIGRMAQNYSFEGNWNVVKCLLETTDSLQVYSTWEVILPLFSSQDWYGNFVHRLVQAIRSMRWQFIHPSVSTDTRPYRRSQRKRGYNDKGSSRPLHKWLPKDFLPVEKIPFTIKEPKPFAWFGVRRN